MRSLAFNSAPLISSMVANVRRNIDTLSRVIVMRNAAGVPITENKLASPVKRLIE